MFENVYTQLRRKGVFTKFKIMNRKPLNSGDAFVTDSSPRVGVISPNLAVDIQIIATRELIQIYIYIFGLIHGSNFVCQHESDITTTNPFNADVMCNGVVLL